MTDHGRDVALEEVQGSGNQDLVGLWVNSESDHFVFGDLFFWSHVSTLTVC